MFLRRVLLSLVVLVVVGVAAQPVLGAIRGDSGLRSDTIVRGSLAATSSSSKAVLAAPELWPGAAVTGSVTISNSGTLAGTYRLRAVVTGSAALARALRLVVREGATTLYDGPLGALDETRLGTFAAGESRRYAFRVALPLSAGNEVQGLSAAATFSWTATAA